MARAAMTPRSLAGRKPTNRPGPRTDTIGQDADTTRRNSSPDGKVGAARPVKKGTSRWSIPLPFLFIMRHVPSVLVIARRAPVANGRVRADTRLRLGDGWG